VSVTEVVPSHFAALVPQFSTVVNDDDIGEIVEKAAELPNGLMLHEYTDIEKEKRQAFYYGNDSQNVPATLQSQLLGKRSKRDYDIIQEKHLRDYTFSEVRGGTKGEKADYMLIMVDNQYKYVPI
jgi:hypothetical protein